MAVIATAENSTTRQMDVGKKGGVVLEGLVPTATTPGKYEAEIGGSTRRIERALHQDKQDDVCFIYCGRQNSLVVQRPFSIPAATHVCYLGGQEGSANDSVCVREYDVGLAG